MLLFEQMMLLFVSRLDSKCQWAEREWGKGCLVNCKQIKDHYVTIEQDIYVSRLEVCVRRFIYRVISEQVRN